jgi:hypothetical protein
VIYLCGLTIAPALAAWALLASTPDGATAYIDAAGHRLTRRSREEIAGYFDGLDLVDSGQEATMITEPGQ